MEVAQSDGTTLRLLYSADNMPSGGYPVAGDVRQFTVYGPNDEFDGTLAVAPLSSVAAGVAQDNGVGTAVLTAANVQTALTAQGLTTTRAGYLDNLSTAPPDAATVASSVWSAATRTLTSGGGGGASASEVADAVWSAASRTLTITIPSAAEIASAVWSAATRTLTSTIPAASDVASAVWSAATRTLTSSSAPAASDVASAVWANTNRTITGGTVDTLTNAPTVPSKEAIATQVRTELKPELDRVANCSTVDTTATAIQDAVSS
jgi:hypothetical protein